jgi:hypothetical protein
MPKAGAVYHQAIELHDDRITKANATIAPIPATSKMLGTMPKNIRSAVADMMHTTYKGIANFLSFHIPIKAQFE